MTFVLIGALRVYNEKVVGVLKSEVGSRKSMEKAGDIQFRSWNTTFYIFTAMKYNFLNFHGCET